MSTRNCHWCGKIGYEKKGYRAPEGWVGKSMGWSGTKWFCSKKCETDFENQNNKKTTQNNLISSSNDELKLQESIIKENRKIRELELEKLEQIKTDEEERIAKIKRNEKSNKLKQEGKPLTAFLVNLNPNFYYATVGILTLAFGYGGFILGLWFIGVLTTLIFIFLGFLIKDFFKLENKKGNILIISLAAITIISTVIAIYMLPNNENYINESIDNYKKEISNENSSTTKTLEETYYKIEDPDGYSNLRKTPGGDIIKKVYEGEMFTVLGEKGKYKKVELEDGTIGYIHSSRVVKGLE